MMKLYTVRDSKVGAYLAPFQAENNLTAVRYIQNVAMNPEAMLSKFPSDFELFLVGEFDDQTGRIFVSTHEALGKVIDLIKMP